MADEPVDALDLDALLREALAVEPSPAFLPRVRQQIAEPALRRWRWTWLAPVTATATLAIAVWPADVRPPNPPAAPRLAVTVPARAAPSLPASVVPRTGHRVPDIGYRSPEVIVDQRQRAALLSFMRTIEDGRLPDDAFKHTTAAPVTVAEDVFEIFPLPVAVSPIVVGGVLHFDVGRN
jgi:hypothetical protein